MTNSEISKSTLSVAYQPKDSFASLTTIIHHLHVSERLNTTIMNYTWINRVRHNHKYFKDIRCFFYEVYMCLVDRNQLVNCLIFNYNVSNCTDQNYCKNGRRCLHNRQAGEIRFACVCPECSYGLFCQLTMTQYRGKYLHLVSD